MIERIAAEMEKIQWDRATIADFLGGYLTEPKPSVFFDPPEPPLSLKRFEAAAAKGGVRLDRRSQLLFSGKQFYINGEKVAVPAAARQAIMELADKRVLERATVSAPVVELLYQWYCDGFLHLK